MKKLSEDVLKSFLWDNSAGYGYFPVSGAKYDDSYFDKYVAYENTEFGRKLNRERVEFVRKMCGGKVLDIGIGCGSFIKEHGNAVGYDVCEKSVEWLKERGIYRDPYKDNLDDIEAVTFFDSFEHIDHIEPLVSSLKAKVLILALPIFRGKNDVLTSKHFRTDEHYHYFTINSLIRFFHSFNMRCVWVSDYESKIGRDSIITFCFSKA